METNPSEQGQDSQNKTSGQVLPQASTISKHKSRLGKITPKKRWQKIVLICLVLLIALAVIAAVMRPKDEVSKSEELVVCDASRLNNVSGILNAESAEFLEPEAMAIQKLPDYDKDPNCLNVVTTFYIHVSDYNQAKSHLDKLELVYDSEKGFSKDLGLKAKTIETLRSNVDFLEEQQKTLEDRFVPTERIEQ